MTAMARTKSNETQEARRIIERKREPARAAMKNKKRRREMSEDLHVARWNYLDALSFREIISLFAVLKKQILIYSPCQF